MEQAVPPKAVVLRPVAALKPHPHNSRTHPKSQLNRLAASLKAFGAVRPVLVDDTDTIIAGHGIWEAAKLAGLTDLPVLRISHLSPDQIRAYVIADNKLAQLSKWNDKELALEFEHLLSLEGGFDVAVTGFDVAEIDLLLEPQAAADAADTIPAPVSGPAITKSGQLWALGKHRILCADALKPASYKELLGATLADVAFTDPPFNVKIDGHVSGRGRRKHREFAMAVGELSKTQFTTFLAKALRLVHTHSRPGAVSFICMDWRHIGELLLAGERAQAEFLNMCVWAKTNPGMGPLYRSQHELVFVFRMGSVAHRNNVQLGRFGRNRSNLWTYPSPTALGEAGEERDLLAEHPTPKPVRMVADALLDVSSRGGAVLDPFLGSGSTLIAAERTGRACFGLELDPLYVDLAIRRFQRLTGEQAVDTASGKTFTEAEKAEEGEHG